MSKISRMASLGTTTAVNAQVYIEDVFSVLPYTGNSGAQSLVTSIPNFSTAGGLFWAKYRAGSPGNASHNLWDTARGTSGRLFTDQAVGADLAATITSFDANGVTLPGAYANTSNTTYGGWFFTRASKFFDCVTFTSNSTANQRISHSLGIAPGMILVKSISTTEDWRVYHVSNGINSLGVMNTTAAFASAPGSWGTSNPTTSDFGINSAALGGTTYIAYIFAHDSSANGLIQCGTYTGNGSASGPVISTGWEPQYVMVKCSSSTGDWMMMDSNRGFPYGAPDSTFFANTNGAEVSSTNYINPNATGFTIATTNAEVNTSAASYVYMTIRRGPMKSPTVGTQIYNAIARTGSAAIVSVTGLGFNPDVIMAKARSAPVTTGPTFSKLGGVLRRWAWQSAAAEITTDTNSLTSFNAAGFGLGADTAGSINANAVTFINWGFQRYPTVFDVVAYTGTGANATVTHNLGVTPELWIIKGKSVTGDAAGSASIPASEILKLETTAAVVASTTTFNSTYPTLTSISLGTDAAVNANGSTYLGYLFASKSGISKVGTYFGNAMQQAINCGFSAGARYVMIKRLDATGDWYVWDTTRGIGSGNNPHLSLNTASAEVTTDASVIASASGFTVNQNAVTNINAISTVGNWVSNTMATSDSVYITASPTTFVTMPGTNPSSTATSSADGTTWASRTLPASRNWAVAAWGNGKFVAMASSSTAGAYSSDGTTWTANSIGLTSTQPIIAYGNGIFLALAGGGTNGVSTSVDGITWSPTTANITLSGFSNTTCLVYGAGLWVLVGAGTSTYYTSPDGLTWTLRNDGVTTSDSVTSITYGNGKFVALNRNTNKALYSTDGLTWANSTLPSTAVWYAIAYGNGVYMASIDNAGSNLGAISTDGINWYSIGFPQASRNYRSIAFASTLGNFALASFNNSGGVAKANTWPTQVLPDANARVAGAFGNNLFALPSYTTASVLTTVDGVNYTARTLPGINCNSIAYGAGRFVGTSTVGTVMTSTDGITWSFGGNVGFTMSTNAKVIYANNIFLIVAGDGSTNVSTSTDGVAWSAQTANIALTTSVQRPNAISWGNGVYLLANGVNSVYRSTDGITWTTSSALVTNFNSLTTAYGNGIYLITGSVSGAATTTYYTSPDGSTWTARVMPISGIYYGMCFGGGYFATIIGVGSTSAFLSVDGINWNTCNTATAFDERSIFFGNGFFLAPTTGGVARAFTLYPAGFYQYVAIA